jgi:uncharacterized protein (TIGR00730 family)
VSQDHPDSDAPLVPLDPAGRTAEWDRRWHDYWRRSGPVGFEARLTSEDLDHEREFLIGRRTPQGERDRMNRIMQEFSEGFERLYGLGPAVSVFGSSRFHEGTPYYQLGLDLGRRLARAGFTVMTGGGPGLMEAANRGAQEAGGPSIGCNAVLPGGPEPNPYLDGVVRFNHLFTSKVMLVKYSCAFVCLPGGFGTLDGLFEAATLIRSGKIGPFPLVLLGESYWLKLREFVFQMVEEGVIAVDDVGFAIITDSAEHAVDLILRSLPDDVKALLKPLESDE